MSTEHMSGLHCRLAEQANAESLLDIAYRTVDSPVGSLLLAATPEGLVRVGYECEGFDDVLQKLAERISPRILAAPPRLDEVARQLDEYFSGARRQFDLAIDYRLSSGFRRLVLTHLVGIEYGRTATYSDVAAMTDSPKAVRAVGTACATNPLPVIVPCHRVVRSDGLIGNYIGGTPAKVALIQLERTPGS